MRVKLSPKLSSYIRCSPFLASAASDVDPQPGPSGRGRSRGGGRGKRGRGGAGGRKAAAAAAAAAAAPAVDPTAPDDQAATRSGSQPTGTKNQSFCALPTFTYVQFLSIFVFRVCM